MNAAPAPLPLRFALPAAAAYGLAIYAALPAGVVACNDDFGYLRSVVQTLQHGRPWTDDWLEPWSASFSLLAAGLYRLTGHFPFAVHGLLAALAAVSFLGAFSLFHARRLETAPALGAAVVLLTFPVLLWKTLEFTGVALYVPCLLWALWAAETRRWLLFGLAWAVAVASRQSAVVWLALPAWEAVRHLHRRSPASTDRWRGPALVLVGAVPWLALLVGTLNTSHAQAVRTAAVFQRLDAAAGLATFAAGLGVFALAAGLGAGVLALGRPAAAVRRPGAPFRWLVGAALIVAIAAVDVRPVIHWDIVAFDGPLGNLYWKALVAAALAGWALVPVRLLPGPAALAGASLLLLAVRGDRYDYYFADLALAAFFGLRPADAGAVAGSTPSPRPARRLLLAGLGVVLLAAVHARFGFTLKLGLDRAWSLCALYEPALRAGKIGPGELRDAPFGYLGWHLHPYAVARGSDTFRRFIRLDRRASTVGWELAPPAPALAPAGTLADATHPHGWVRTQRYLLRRVAPPGADADLGRDFRLVPFPLDAAEWRSLIAAPPPRARKN